MSIPCLKKFISTVPTCLTTTTLAAVLEMFSQNQCDRLMVVTEQQHPLGLLHLSSLLPYLIAKPAHGVTGNKAQGSMPKAPESNLQQCLSQLGLSMIQPLATLSGDLSLKQVQPYLQQQTDTTQPHCDWAVVALTGKFLGLLDSPRLLQFMLAHPQAALAEEDAAQPETLKAPEAEENLHFSTPHAPCPMPHSQLNPLLQLLERLPLPLMLQTRAGQVLRQNLAWRRHFGSLQDPDWLRREAAPLLESLPNREQAPSAADSGMRENLTERASRPTHALSRPNNIDAGISSNFATLADGNAILLKEPVVAGKGKREKGKAKGKENKRQAVRTAAGTTSAPTARSPNLQGSHSFGGWSRLSASPSLLDRNSQTQPLTGEGVTPAPSASTACQLGPNPDSCICVCPMQNGSERVWQFIKIPLGNVLSSQEAWAEKAIAQEPPSDRLAVPQFRLANFGSSTNPADAAHPPSGSGGSDLWLVMAQDVTEQQQVAKELAAKNADLIQLNRLKDEFLACISHELRTPLTAVLGLSSLLKDRLLGDLNERQARYVRLIHQSGRHLMTVVNDILDLTRIETGQLELVLSQVNLSTVCDRAYQQARQLYMMQSNLEQQEDAPIFADEPRFTLEIEPGLDNFVADELRLRQMLAHLLSNALKFTQADGSIGLRVSRWEGWIAFNVWDTGIGIPEQKQHLIFQKFQQLEHPLTRQFQGTGLGLVLTQRLAHLHGGDVSFISKEGSGSQFTLLLPPCPPQQPGEQGNRETGENDRPMPHPSSSIPQSRLVLIVEATSRFIEDLSEKLIGLGYRVAIARSGTEALAKARALQPGVIFLNPLLPLLSGWDVLTLLKSNAQTRHIPVVVTATMVEKKQAYSNRADEFLCMPVQLGALRQSLEHLTALPVVQEQSPYPDTKLTILYLSTGNKSTQAEEHLKPNSPLPLHDASVQSYTSDGKLTRLLHRHHYRVLEADDLEQAELLARIWQPHVVLLERATGNPLTYLQQLSQYPALTILPLITLDGATTQAANQVKGLSVFPCLEPPGSPKETSALLQAIQVAAGIAWKPSILVVDIGMLPDLIKPVAPEQQPRAAANPPNSKKMGTPETAASTKKRTEWQKALIQYLQTAGFKSVIAHSWDEVLQQMQHHSVDLLLIDLGDSTPNSAVVKAFCALRQFACEAPKLVLDRRLKTARPTEQGYDDDKQQAGDLSDVLNSASTRLVQDVATEILPASVSMKELLDRIRQTLAEKGSKALGLFGNR